MCLLNVGHEKGWIRIRIEFLGWIRFRIETNTDPKHWMCLDFLDFPLLTVKQNWSPSVIYSILYIFIGFI